MAKRDYYAVLGVAKDADERKLKVAYRRVAMRNHPDRNQGDEAAEERLKEANEAYGVLSDSEQRSTYDRLGHDGLRMAQQGGGFSGGAGGFGAGFEDIFGDIFSNIFRDSDFGGGSRSHRRQQGRHLRFGLTLDLEKAVKGCSERITLPSRPVVCTSCKGDGAAPGSAPERCRHCQGSGVVRMTQGIFTMQQSCPHCGGSGSEIGTTCGDCSGSGRVNESETMSVRIPPGVDDGEELRLHAKGEAGVRGAPPGDLFIRVNVPPHPMFRREGSDLRCEATVSMIEAALGGPLDLPALGGGKLRAKLKAGTQSGEVLRLRGKGVRTLRRALPGDLLCRIVVETPRKLDENQQRLLLDLADTMDDKTRHSPQRDSWVQRLKQHFSADGGR